VSFAAAPIKGTYLFVVKMLAEGILTHVSETHDKLMANELMANELMANELMANELMANELMANELMANKLMQTVSLCERPHFIAPKSNVRTFSWSRCLQKAF
jgi:hypothetical protein